MARDTRKRIVTTALRMFNEQRFKLVTTAALAEEVGIAEGNLWYHFNNKRQLLDAITEDFIKLSDERTAIKIESPDTVLEDYKRLLDATSREVRDYRFMYRDMSEYGEHSDILQERIPDIWKRSIAQFQMFFDGMIDVGILKASKNYVPDLAENVVIVLRYYLESLRERGEDDRLENGAVAAAFVKHLTLFEDKLSPAAAKNLRHFCESVKIEA